LAHESLRAEALQQPVEDPRLPEPGYIGQMNFVVSTMANAWKCP
jgi:hypothetical protein